MLSGWRKAWLLLLSLVPTLFYIHRYANGCQASPKEHIHLCVMASAVSDTIDWFLDFKGEDWTAFFTMALFVSTTGLWIYTARLWRDARNQRRDNRRAIFANLQIAKTAKRSASLARDEFIASHRPEFIIHSIDVLSESVEIRDQSSDAIATEPPLHVSFILINAGTSAGTILSSAAYLEYLENDESPWRNTPRHIDFVERHKFAAGRARTLMVKGNETSGEDFIFPPESKHLYFYGWILYVDDRGFERTTYFCRRYAEKLDRFTPIEDPEANKTY